MGDSASVDAGASKMKGQASEVKDNGSGPKVSLNSFPPVLLSPQA